MENYSHQERLFDPKNARPVVVIGAGAIGSYVTLVLANMGASDITVIDGDSVASHNGPMSLYKSSDTGRLKVQALKEKIAYLTDVEINVIPEYYVDQALKRPGKMVTVIACVDKMETGRQVIWDHVKGEFTIDLFIDTRTAAAYTEVFAITPCLPEEQVYYESFLYPDEEAAPQNCGAHGVAFCSFRVASTVGAIVSRYWQHGEKKLVHAEKCDTLEIVQL